MSKTLKIKQGLDEGFLREILVRDISPTEAVFDLIDNSIDAARNAIFDKGDPARDNFGLIADYGGKKIALRITQKIIAVSDNSQGFRKATLADEAFIIGKASRHTQGVGYFGIGMKRALLALGRTYGLSTSSRDLSAFMTFSSQDLSARSAPLEATLRTQRRSDRTLIAVGNLSSGALHEFGGDLESLRTQLSRRYGLFIRKGLSITLNGRLIRPFAPSIRIRGPIKPQRWQGNAAGVHAFIEAGMHASYRQTKEADYDRDTNNGLTDQYGWFIVCNDRVIEVATKDNRLGFSSYWHPEYNGFLGWVHFVSDDPSELPWNTKKTQIDPNSATFRAIFEKLVEFSDAFRRENRATRKPKNNTAGGGGKKTATGRTSGGSGAGKSKGGSSTAPKPKAGEKNHVNNWATLLPPMEFSWKDAKIESLLAEAEDLQIDFSYSGCALLRMIVERTVDQHIRRSGKLNTVKSDIVGAQIAAGRTFTQDQQDNFEPSLNDLLSWLNKNKAYFPEEFRKDTAQSAAKFLNHLTKTINGAMHRSTIVSRDQLIVIRNEVYPLLSFLLSQAPSKNP